MKPKLPLHSQMHAANWSVTGQAMGIPHIDALSWGVVAHMQGRRHRGGFNPLQIFFRQRVSESFVHISKTPPLRRNYNPPEKNFWLRPYTQEFRYNHTRASV